MQYVKPAFSDFYCRECCRIIFLIRVEILVFAMEEAYDVKPGLHQRCGVVCLRMRWRSLCRPRGPCHDVAPMQLCGRTVRMPCLSNRPVLLGPLREEGEHLSAHNLAKRKLDSGRQVLGGRGNLSLFFEFLSWLWTLKRTGGQACAAGW